VKRCLSCDGTGFYLYQDAPSDTCPDCKGTGAIPDDAFAFDPEVNALLRDVPPPEAKP